MPIEKANIDNWSMGQGFPTAAQNPYFDINAFAYPASYTVGSLGARVLQAPGIWWMQCFATKTGSRSVCGWMGTICRGNTPIFPRRIPLTT